MSFNVAHNYSISELHHLIENTEGRKVYEALGYLSTWSPQSYPVCEIYIHESECEITAMYFDKKEGWTKRYVIGAVWHDDHFGFHS